MPNWTNPYLYYSMDSTTISGTTITDLGTGGHNGTLNGGPTTTTGIINQALAYSAVNSQYIQGASLGNNPVWSIAAWINRNSTQNNDACIFTDIFVSSHVQYCMGFGSDLSGDGGSLGVGFYNGSWNAVSTTVPSNTWFHAVGTYDGTTIKIYINGSLITSLSVTATPGTDAGGFRSGRRWDSGVYFLGSIDELRFYNFALTSTDVTSLYAYRGWQGFGDWSLLF